MKKIVFITLSLLLAVSFWNCEKDDICADGNANTPFVVIEFYDALNTTTLKNVTNLGVGEPTFDTRFSFTGISKIEVPLRTNSTTTTLNFIENGGDTTDTSDDNPDAITFNYATSNVYISRACGYKTIFQLDPTTPIVLSPDSANWIQNIVVSQPNIENENEVHVKIYF
jgi:hypothetical protein